MQEIYSIENDLFVIKFKAKGAELCSAVHKESGREFIWQADSVWPRHAPLLFPNVGSLLDHEYIFEGKMYSMSHHGFARDRTFAALHQSQDSIAFVLSSDGQSLASFPFEFSLIVRYSLEGNKLVQKFRLINEGAVELYASFGGHPAFSISDPSEYNIVFEKVEDRKSHRLTGPYINDMTIEVLEGDTIALNHKIFDEDALIFKDLQSNWVELRHKYSNHAVRVDIEQWPFLGIWSKPGAKFVCIEPWQGLADHINHDKEWINKEGILKLGVEEQVSAAFSMRFSC